MIIFSSPRYMTAHRGVSGGFAIVATLTVTSLVVVIALALVTLASVTVRTHGHSDAMDQAKANARLALASAINLLQSSIGPDQAVCAEAAIYEVHDDPNTGSSESEYVSNRHWLGVWDTGVNGYPVVGKNADVSGIGPYATRGLYSDLRHTDRDLANGAWKTKMRKLWLVSGGESANYTEALDFSSEDNVVLVGRGTLGDRLADDIYTRMSVVVPKLSIEVDDELVGKYGFWVTNNNLKAKVVQSPEKKLINPMESDIVVAANPAAVSYGEARPLEAFQQNEQENLHKLVSYNSLQLVSEELREVFKSSFHDFTVKADGLFTNVQLGGFRRDLMPLLFGQKGQSTVTIAVPNLAMADYPVVSSDPIIPGGRKAVMGPSLDALRNWGLKKYTPGLSAGRLVAETDSETDAGLRYRSAIGWQRGLSDGVSFESSTWASQAPKIHPVMTESRFHFYFSHHGEKGVDANIRTHLIPRVCLWNPYNIELEVGRMVVLMPNPFTSHSGNVAFHLEEEERDRLKAKFTTTGTTFDPVTGDRDDLDYFASWSGDSVIFRGNNRNGKDGLFPKTRYLGFELEPVVMKPGECLVFSPKGDRADVSAGGAHLARYDRTNISKNVLSAKSLQGTHHFFHDYAIEQIQIPYGYNKPVKDEEGNPVVNEDGEFDYSGGRVNGSGRVGADVLHEIDFSKCYDYALWTYTTENWVHVLKAANGSTALAPDSLADVSATKFPTLQIINSGNGGSNSHVSLFYSWYWGMASKSAFGNLDRFEEVPMKDAPQEHHVGAKMLWLDESYTEANAPPLRVGRWGASNVAYNFPILAHGNVRPQLVTRSPATQCGREWYVNVAGSWLNSFKPYSPQDSADIALRNSEGYYAKNPMGAASAFDAAGRVVLFDLPHAEFGALSIGALRHASLSPYSWHPSYVIGSSLADLHAPAELSAHEVLQLPYAGADPNLDNAFSYWTGGSSPYSLDWGPRSNKPYHASLLQLGVDATSKLVDGQRIDSVDENLTYDIVFEVNQNVWDNYFISGMPLSEDTESFAWRTSQALFNDAYVFNSKIDVPPGQLEHQLQSGLADGFWHNGYYLKNEISFNVNSTSVNAWLSYLSGLRDTMRDSASGAIGGEGLHVFTRVRKPLGAAPHGALEPVTSSAFDGGRILTDDELVLLANCIVREVKQRGPFLSISDFVNRRLSASSDPASLMGALEAAIQHSRLNSPLEPEIWKRSIDDGWTNNHPIWRPDYKRQAKSKAWGIPSYLIQSDILTPLAPIISVRGDTFTIRAYGEAVIKGEVMARAYLEAVVVRGSEYMETASVHAETITGQGNRPTAPVMKIATGTGVMTRNNLSETNQRFGRKFIVQGVRWMTVEEI